MIIIETPAPPTRERLVLVPPESCTPVFDDGKPAGLSIRAQGARDATPEDLARAGLVLREQAAPGTLAHLRADLRDAIARAEKAERERDERNEAKEFARVLEVERDTLLAELADAKAECQGAMLSAYAQYAETVRERDEAKELARVLEVERDTLRAELADAKAERDRAIRDCAATAAERNEARAEVARLGVAHERARQQPAQDRATEEELERVYSVAYARAWESEVSTPDRGERAGLLAVAARVRGERCLVARTVGDQLIDSVSIDRVTGGRIRVRVVRRRDPIANPDGESVEAFCKRRSDVPATLARLLGEVSHG